MIQTNVLIDIIRLEKPVLFKQWNMALLFYSSYFNRISINLNRHIALQAHFSLL